MHVARYQRPYALANVASTSLKTAVSQLTERRIKKSRGGHGEGTAKGAREGRSGGELERSDATGRGALLPPDASRDDAPRRDTQRSASEALAAPHCLHLLRLSLSGGRRWSATSVALTSSATGLPQAWTPEERVPRRRCAARGYVLERAGEGTADGSRVGSRRRWFASLNPIQHIPNSRIRRHSASLAIAQSSGVLMRSLAVHITAPARHVEALVRRTTRVQRATRAFGRQCGLFVGARCRGVVSTAYRTPCHVTRHSRDFSSRHSSTASGSMALPLEEPLDASLCNEATAFRARKDLYVRAGLLVPPALVLLSAIGPTAYFRRSPPGPTRSATTPHCRPRIIPASKNILAAALSSLAPCHLSLPLLASSNMHEHAPRYPRRHVFALRENCVTSRVTARFRSRQCLRVFGRAAPAFRP
uniref:Uncharacterized protein n=1 Tax=Mycena chlorophos TaxID=658473 RepID=A0ABQ0L2D6_MYCCL|nr:predicted protein [Mycena chlorophos]